MKIVNKTRNSLLTENASEAKSLMEKTIGLIGEKSPKAIVLRTSFGIHTFGVRFPLDILILDSEMTVKKIKENLQKNSFFFWNPKFDLVLELPAGVVKKSQTALGDKIEFKESRRA